MADSHVAVKDDYELINVQNFGIKERKREEEQAGEGEVKTESPQKQKWKVVGRHKNAKCS